jgi:hypothetical protein
MAKEQETVRTMRRTDGKGTEQDKKRPQEKDKGNVHGKEGRGRREGEGGRQRGRGGRQSGRGWRQRWRGRRQSGRGGRQRWRGGREGGGQRTGGRGQEAE